MYFNFKLYLFSARFCWQRFFCFYSPHFRVPQLRRYWLNVWRVWRYRRSFAAAKAVGNMDLWKSWFASSDFRAIYNSPKFVSFIYVHIRSGKCKSSSKNQKSCIFSRFFEYCLCMFGLDDRPNHHIFVHCLLSLVFAVQFMRPTTTKTN